MWIRNQNKTILVKLDQFFIGNKTTDNIVYGTKEGELILLGKYISNERALEILDQIQRELFNGTKMDYITSGGVRHYREKVFEMPKK